MASEPRRYVSFERVEALADLVLERSGITRPPVDVDAIADRAGLRYELVELARVSGAYYYEGEGRGRAYISSSEHPLRQVFSKAHELGHHLMDEPTVARAAGYPFLQLPTGYRGRESHWAHDWFAACLLMPRAWVGEYMRERGWRLDRDPMIADVARRFGVSRRAAQVRLERLGHLEGGPQ